MNWSKKDIVNICKIVAFGIILYWVLNNIGMFGTAFGTLCNILSPFIWGAAIAFVINIPMTIFEKKIFVKKKKTKKKSEVQSVSKVKRIICILLSLIIIILIIIGVIFLVIPEIINVIGEIIAYLPQLLTDAKDVIKQLAIDYPEIEGSLASFQTNLESFNSEVIKELTTMGTNLLTSSFGVISSTISVIIKFFIAIIFATYILIDKEKISLQLTKILYAFLNEKTANKICEIARISRKAFNNFITGQFTECIILGALCTIGMLILRLPYSTTVGVLVAITAFIPIVGALIGGIIGVILLLPISLTKAITFLVFFVILQQIENNLIYPRVVGNSVGVPGLIVLIAITIGGALFGAIGMVVALPLTSVLYTLFCDLTDKKLKEKKFTKTLEYQKDKVI
jgi:predicted PurR-regulated permease PerM